MVDGERFYEALLQGSVDEVERLTQDAIDAGETFESILNDGLMAAMDRIGVKFKNEEIYIPEVLRAARAMRAGVAIIKPLLPSSTGSSMGKVVIGTVKGDLHDIGKNLVVMMLESGGFKVFDLGVDVSIEKFIEAVQTHQAQVVGLSALLTTTIMEMKHTLEAIEEAGIRKQVKVIIGGAPVTEKFAKEIGADGYAPNAALAVDVARDLLSEDN